MVARGMSFVRCMVRRLRLVLNQRLCEYEQCKIRCLGKVADGGGILKEELCKREWRGSMELRPSKAEHLLMCVQ